MGGDLVAVGKPMGSGFVSEKEEGHLSQPINGSFYLCF